jgi:hypothetical protein
MVNRNINQSPTWIVLIHQLPVKPEALRMSVWRDLQKVGAYSLKNSIYLLPDLSENYSNLEKIAFKIRENGGECYLLKSDEIDGLDSKILKAYFKSNADKIFTKLNLELQAFLKSLRKISNSEDHLMNAKHTIGSLLKKFEDASKIDFFGSEARERAKKYLSKIDEHMSILHGINKKPQIKIVSKNNYSKRIWVTRSDIKVDRIASAWLIQNFIDPQARFKFVSDKNYKQKNKECCFDMFGGEFTHIDNLCTFEVLLKSFDIQDQGLESLAEIIHDLDFKDEKYELKETSTVETILNGIIREYNDDLTRIEQASHFLKHLRISLKAK